MEIYDIISFFFCTLTHDNKPILAVSMLLSFPYERRFVFTTTHTTRVLNSRALGYVLNESKAKKGTQFLGLRSPLSPNPLGDYRR